MHAHAQICVRVSPNVLAYYSTLFRGIEKRKHMKEELFMTYIIKLVLGEAKKMDVVYVE